MASDHPAGSDAQLMDWIYREIPLEEIPWCHHEPPEQIVELVDSGWAEPGPTVELGCGAGCTTVWLATRGFQVTGLDVAPHAIALASRLAAENSVSVELAAFDLTQPITHLDEGFDLALDWEVLHHVAPAHRPRYVANVHRMLRNGGRYASFTFSVKDPFGVGDGPVRTTTLGTTLYFSSVSELRQLYEPLFEIEDLTTVTVRGSRKPHLAIKALLHRRNVPVR
jgi:cyclopropane fatty-acyl-phospholipid synthase-like methyltransferase